MRRAVGHAILLLVCVLLPGTSSYAAPREEVHETALPLRNWIPATGSHPPPLTEGKPTATALPSVGSHFIAVTPCRIVDTRRPDGAHGGPILSGGVPRAFSIPTGPCPGIPAAAAYSLNVSVTGSAAGSSQFLTAYPAGTSRPTIATMVFAAGETASNAALVPADETGSIEIYVSTSSHVILDINGYVEEGVVTAVSPGTGLEGGGTGEISLSVAPGGIGATELGASAVTTGAIADAAVTGAKIANAEVVRDVNGVRDSLSIVGTGSASVTTSGSIISVNAAPEVPAGTMILGEPNDTTLIASGYSELGPVAIDFWRETATAGAPTARKSHTAVWTGQTMIVWGGAGTLNELLQTGGRYDPASDSWTPTTTAGAPSARGTHTAVWTGSKMIVWGGADASGALLSGAQYDPVADSWTSTSTAFPARRQHKAVWTGTSMIVWGGLVNDVRSNSGSVYSPASDTWSSTTTTGAPSGRTDHTAVWDGTRMLVWGGLTDAGLTDTGGAYSPSSNSWATIDTLGAPSPRMSHTAIWTGSEMIVWGGYTGGGPTDGALFKPSTGQWRSMNMGGAPPAAQNAGAVWTGTEMIVWGGAGSGGVYLNTGGRYEPLANRWSATSAAGAPVARWGHTAVWTGQKMIVWGGSGPTSSTLPDGGGRWGSASLYRKD